MLKINPDGTYSAHFKCLKGVLKGSKEFKCSNNSMEIIENQPFCDTISEDITNNYIEMDKTRPKPFEEIMNNHSDHKTFRSYIIILISIVKFIQYY